MSTLNLKRNQTEEEIESFLGVVIRVNNSIEQRKEFEFSGSLVSMKERLLSLKGYSVKIDLSRNSLVFEKQTGEGMTEKLIFSQKDGNHFFFDFFCEGVGNSVK